MGFVTQQDPSVNPYSVEKIIYHRNYKPKTMGNDIALMKLAAPLALNGNFFPLCFFFFFNFKLKIGGISSNTEQKSL